MHAFEQRLAELWPACADLDVTVVVAVSGGADSIALLRALLHIAGDDAERLVVAHYNHRLRPVDAERDEALVVQLCTTLGVACKIGHSEGKLGQENSGDGLEAKARSERYDFLKATAHKCGARYIATAHTLDDQAETVLHRIVRGTGIAGLAGIPRTRTVSPSVTVVRPLLGVRRAEVVAYLDSIAQPFRDDASNLDLRFTRNRLRHDLLPQLAAQYNERVVEALCRLSALAGDAQALIDEHVQAALQRSLIHREADLVTIDRAKLADESRFVQSEVLKTIWRMQGWSEQSMSYDHWCRLAASLFAESSVSSSNQALPRGLTARCVENQIHLSRAIRTKP